MPLARLPADPVVPPADRGTAIGKVESEHSNASMEAAGAPSDLLTAEHTSSLISKSHRGLCQNPI